MSISPTSKKISQFSFNSAEVGDDGLDKGLGHSSYGKCTRNHWDASSSSSMILLGIASEIYLRHH